jgi:hypothetical protein
MDSSPDPEKTPRNYLRITGVIVVIAGIFYNSMTTTRTSRSMLREWRLVREQAASLQKNDGGRGWVSMVEFDGRISIDNFDG